MVNELELAGEDKAFHLLLKAYTDLSEWLVSPPDLEALSSHYGVLADGELMNYMASVYGDDFYDGSPNKKANFLPDNLKGDVSEHVKVPLNLTYKQIVEMLNRHSLVYKDEGIYFNAPLQEVW